MPLIAAFDDLVGALHAFPTDVQLFRSALRRVQATARKVLADDETKSRPSDSECAALDSGNQFVIPASDSLAGGYLVTVEVTS